jgi:hypothetical protein
LKINSLEFDIFAKSKHHTELDFRYIFFNDVPWLIAALGPQWAL